jgi:hypothetical protein
MTDDRLNMLKEAVAKQKEAMDRLTELLRRHAERNLPLSKHLRRQRAKDEGEGSVCVPGADEEKRMEGAETPLTFDVDNDR